MRMRFQILLIASTLLFAGPALAQPAPEDIISQGDKNADKALDKAEWTAMGAPIDYPEEADTNHDGKIDIAELNALFSQFQAGGPPPPAQAPAASPPPAQAPAN